MIKFLRTLLDSSRYDACNHAPNENLIIDLFFKGIKCNATVFNESAAIQ